MTYQSIAEMIKSVGLPYAYYQFEEGQGSECPFIVFYYPARNDYAADGENYAKIENLTIELYTANKDFEIEAKLETVLGSNDLYFEKSETYIDSEKCFEIVYTMEVLING